MVSEVKPERLNLDVCPFLSMTRPNRPYASCIKGCRFWQKATTYQPAECLWVLALRKIASRKAERHSTFPIITVAEKRP